MLFPLLGEAQLDPGHTSAQPQPTGFSPTTITAVSFENLPEQSHQFFPLIFTSDQFSKDLPIWVHSNSPAAHEVALFRHRFTLAYQVDNAHLAIFADTRYQVWIDGIFIGNGPARSSQTLREYDLQPLGNLLAGDHALSILVQWAPNKRRLESIAPFLKAHIQGTVSGQFRIITRTSQEWKSILSNAWQQDPALVHAWGLIGPTELLDLRLLPADWQAPQYDDSQWANSTVQTRANNEVLYQPRSIPFLVNIPISPSVYDAGLLSPGFRIAEIPESTGQNFAIDFTTSDATSLTLETIHSTPAIDGYVFVDRSVLNWKAVADRQDVYSSTHPLEQGQHQLLFTQIPPRGAVVSVSTEGINYTHLPFEQGTNPGRRLLLADLVSEPEQVLVSSDTGLQLTFPPVPAYVILDLGRTVHGRLSAKVSGNEATIIDIGWDERLGVNSRRPLPFPGTLHPEWNQVDSWILDKSTRNISTIDTRSGRYILIAVWADAPVTFEDIKIYEERFPAVQVGGFLSSDQLLNQVWQIGVDTLYPNMTDAFTDTPWRERGQWWGDVFIEEQIHTVVFSGDLLLKRGLTFMADAPSQITSPGLAPNNNNTHIVDFTMLWVHSLAAYLKRSGDHQLIDALYPSLRSFMDHLESFENEQSGLLDLPQLHWSQIAYVDTLANHSRYGQSTAINALYYATLNRAADIANFYGDSASGEAWSKKAETIKNTINTILYLPAENRYLTTLDQGVAYPPTLHAQAFPAAYGIVPPDKVNDVASSLLELLSGDPTLPNVGVYGMYWVLRGLGEAGRISEALNIIKTYYGHMINSGATSWWENFDADQNYTSSLSHGWGGSPTWFLSSYVLGFTQLSPDTWQFKPASLSQINLDWVIGAIPVGSGSGWITLSQQDCQKATIDLFISGDTLGTIVFSTPDTEYTIELDGELVWGAGNSSSPLLSLQPDGFHILLGVDNHKISIQQTCYPKSNPPTSP